MNNCTFSFGSWQVDKASNTIQQQDVRHQLEPKVMDVLIALCERAGAVVSVDELLLKCWGSNLYGDNPIHKTIAHLRKLLGDSASAPFYIETIRKRGYRTIAPVSFDEPVATWLAESPFRGLEAFDAHHADVFFGREDASARLAEAVLAQVQAGRALVIVLGPSGSGKTSLIQAGLMPLLHKGLDGLMCASMSALDLGLPMRGRLFVELGSAMLDWQLGEEPVFAGESAESLGHILANDPAALMARLAAPGWDAHLRLVLFLDRFEALFASPDVSAQERDALVRAIDRLASSPQLILIAACRNDFYPRLADYPALMQGKAHGAHVDLTRPAVADIARMIRLPAQAAQLRFGTDRQSGARLDDVLCQSVTGSPDALPLLQYTLQELYRQRSADGELSFDVFTSLGGVDGAIGRRVEEVIGALATPQRAALPRVLALLVTLTPTSDAVTSCSARWTDLRDDNERALVTALVDARLVVSELVGSVAGFRVAHEALLRCWLRATEWIAAHRNGLLVRARIGALARRWDEGGRPVDLLLPAGQQLDEARAIAERNDFALSASEMALVRTSFSRARRRGRLRLAAMTLIISLAVLSIGLGLSAYAARGVAEQRRVDAEGLMQFMLGELVEKLRPLGRLDVLDGVSAKALSYLARDSGAGAGAGAVLQRAKALHVIGEVRDARGDAVQAESAFTSARALLLPQLAAQPGNSELLAALGLNAYWLGQIQLKKNALPAARAHFLLYQQYSDRLVALDPANVDYWIEQSYAHNNLGTLAQRAGNMHEAAREFLASIDLKSRALARKPDDRALAAELADSLSWVGDARQSEGKLAEALALYERELALVEATQAAAPVDALLADRRARALLHRAGMASVFGRDDAALRDYAVAEQLVTRNLALEPGNRDWQRTLVLIQMEQLRVRSHQRLTDADLAALAQLARRVDELVRINPQNDDWVKLAATVRSRRGAALTDAAQYGAAKELLDQAGATLAGQFLHDRNDARSRVALAMNYLRQARLVQAGADSDAALAACAAARDVLGPDAAASHDHKVLDAWVRAHGCLGQPEIARAAMGRLSAMGYRDAAYTQYLTTLQ